MRVSLSVVIIVTLSLIGTIILPVSARPRLNKDESRNLHVSLEKLDQYLKHPDRREDVKSFDGLIGACRKYVDETHYIIWKNQLNHAIELLEHIHSIAPSCEPEDIVMMEDVNRIQTRMRLQVVGKFIRESKAINDKNCMNRDI